MQVNRLKVRQDEREALEMCGDRWGLGCLFGRTIYLKLRKLKRYDNQLPLPAERQNCWL